jgi:23S rRNA (cytosine1962-C5)-methyltransferase
MTGKRTGSPSTPRRPAQGNRGFRNSDKRGKQTDGKPSGRSTAIAGNADAPPCIILKPGREKSLLRRHPWIFSGAVERIDGAPASGATLPIRDATGNFLAWAAYNPASQITARVWSWHQAEIIDAEFFRKKISGAIKARSDPGLLHDSSGMRLIHAVTPYRPCWPS